MSWFKSLIAEQFGSVPDLAASPQGRRQRTYLNDIPYCATASKPDFQTKVTSQALVACNLQERKAETALPPTGRQISVFRRADMTMFEWDR